jgi:hypothetical protein
MAAVLNIGSTSSVTRKVLPSQIVVSGDTEQTCDSIKTWAMFWTLYVFYRDAFNRTVKDRYEGKMRHYKSELTRRVTPTMTGLGIPMVLSPLPAPGAVFERASGTWDSDSVTMVDGSGTAAGNYSFAVTYVDMEASSPYVDYDDNGNAESHPSIRATKTITSGHVASIDITLLNPPTGVQHPSQRMLASVSPLKATHWNVWAGLSTGDLYLQNAAPIPIATKTYLFAGDPTLSGDLVGLGQYPDRRFAIVPMRQRG